MMMMMKMMMMMMMMMIMTLMKLVNSATKFRHGMDKFYQPNSGLRGSRSGDEAIYAYIIYIYICIHTHTHTRNLSIHIKCIFIYTCSSTHTPWTEWSDGGLRRAAGHHHDVLLLHERPQAGSDPLDGEVGG